MFLQLNNTKDVSSIAVMLLCHLGYAKEPVIMMRSAKDTQSRISMEECFVVLPLRRLNVLIIGKSFPVEATLLIQLLLANLHFLDAILSKMVSKIWLLIVV